MRQLRQILTIEFLMVEGNWDPESFRDLTATPYSQRDIHSRHFRRLAERQSVPCLKTHDVNRYFRSMKHLFFLLLFSCSVASAQQSIDDFTIVLKPVSIEGLMGLQSYSFAQHDGKILFIGGRLDGLHRRQPWASFDSIGHNNQLVLVDIQTQQVWKAGLEKLTPGLRDQLKATNSCFTQRGEQMIMAGGYGMSTAAGDHVTFPSLIAFHIPVVMDAVKTNAVSQSLFMQKEDPLFAVTGGQLQVLNNEFYLVGGHRFDGRYNPNNGPSFTQTYTSAVRRFAMDAYSGEIRFLPFFESEALLHRRDFNLVLQQNSKGEHYLTAFSGVFREDADLPFLTAVHIGPNGIVEQRGFRQFYNHYHCPDISLYDNAKQEMHTLFFGGIAQYYDSLGLPVQDNNVPFTKAISRVTRSADGSMAEYRLPLEMPLLLGAGSEFIPAYSGDRKAVIFQLNELSGDSILLGHLFGGIASSEKNIFWINEGKESVAYNGLFEVRLVRKPAPAVKNEHSTSPLNVIVERDETKMRYYIDYTMPEGGETISVSWNAANGEHYASKPKKVSVGEHSFSKYLPRKPGTYFIEIIVEGKQQYVWKQYVLVE